MGENLPRGNQRSFGGVMEDGDTDEEEGKIEEKETDREGTTVKVSRRR